MSACIDPITDAPPLCKLDAEILSQLYASGELSPVEVAGAALERAESVQSEFNAFSSIDYEGAMAAARASEARWRRGMPLSAVDGIPTTIKDIVWVKDWIVRFGSKTTSQRPLVEDAPSVALLRAAGGIFIGQTTSPEFAWKPVTDSPLRGVTRNPWDPTKTPGGSSGGAAVAAATGAGVFHLGTDGGGSIRIPASFTGIVGFKPTFGRVPNFPPSGFFSVSHTGPMSRSVTDAFHMLAAMSGRDLRDWTQNPEGLPAAKLSMIHLHSLKVGFWSEPPVGKLDAQVMVAVRRIVEQLVSHGASVEEFVLPVDDVLDLFNHHWLAGAALRYSTMTDEVREDMDPGLRAAAELGLRFSAVELLAAHVKRAHFGAAMDAALMKFDVIISPATAYLPFEVGLNEPPSSNAKSWTEWSGFSYPLNLTGQPACVLPCGLSDTNLPIGLQIIGPRGADGHVLSVAKAIEEIVGNVH
ncbi:aspartyl-tRNA(Asn)/glutamyl-tRNA(Gln) amidotransferase subunit A [Rhizobium pisi]